MMCECTKRVQGLQRDSKEYEGIQRDSKEYKKIQKKHKVEKNGVRMYEEIPRNTTRFQGLRRNCINMCCKTCPSSHKNTNHVKHAAKYANGDARGMRNCINMFVPERT